MSDVIDDKAARHRDLICRARFARECRLPEAAEQYEAEARDLAAELGLTPPAEPVQLDLFEDRP